MTLSRRVGSMLGGDSVSVSGMSVREDDQIICKFGKTAVDGIYISEDRVVCVTPPARKESVVEFRIEVRRGNLNLTGGALYQYSKRIPQIIHNSVSIANHTSSIT